MLLRYYFVKKDILELVNFDKYTIYDNGIVVNKETCKPLRQSKNKGGYNKCSVQDNYGKRRDIMIGRAIASTYNGPPPTSKHTADHKDRNPDNDMIDNIRWLCKSGQIENRTMPETYKSAFIIVKDGVENTTNGWVDLLKDEKNHLGRRYTKAMIQKYAQQKIYGFEYKKYPDLLGEIWKNIDIYNNNKGGRWEISNMCRVKYITIYAENVFSGNRIGLTNGYPGIRINGQTWTCHTLAFMAFFPEEYAAKKNNEFILHEDDDRTDFRPYKLRIGTQSENTLDAHNNGSYDGTMVVRMTCASYVDGILEKEHESQRHAAKYLNTKGYEKADNSSIYQALKAYKTGKVIVRYDRTWKLVE